MLLIEAVSSFGAALIWTFVAYTNIENTAPGYPFSKHSLFGFDITGQETTVLFATFLVTFVASFFVARKALRG